MWVSFTLTSRHPFPSKRKLNSSNRSIQGKIVAQGKLLLRGPLFCTDDPTSGPNFKMREMTVFLFEQVISHIYPPRNFKTLILQIMLFAETVGKKTQFTSPNYNYKAHIQVKHVWLNIGQFYHIVIICKSHASCNWVGTLHLHISLTELAPKYQTHQHPKYQIVQNPKF